MSTNATSGNNQEGRQTGLADAQRTLQSCSDFARGGGAPAPDHDADNPTRRRRVEAEKVRLVEWARAHGKLGSRTRLPVFARGGEHEVFYFKRDRRYLKATIPDRQLGYGIALGSLVHGATPSEYLDRLVLQNQIFHDDIRLWRIVENAGTPIIITSQPAIEGKAATQGDLDDMMTEMGYEKMADGAYYDSEAGLLIFDLFPRNAIQTADGVIYPIDPVIQRIAPDFGDFLREHPYTINLR